MTPPTQVVVLACRQAVPNLQFLLKPLQEVGLQAQVVLEPCSSKVEAYQLLRLLATQADLVWVIGCPESDCQFLEGSTRMGQRVAYAQKYLEEIGLEADRLGMNRLPAGDEATLSEIIAAIRDRAQSLGVSPARQAAS